MHISMFFCLKYYDISVYGMMIFHHLDDQMTTVWVEKPRQKARRSWAPKGYHRVDHWVDLHSSWQAMDRVAEKVEDSDG